jgi:hypothetical protein
MPPWYADPHYGKFSNTMNLTAAEIDTVSRWADGGAPEGDPRDLPKPVDWVEGWGIGKPDMVFELPQAFDVPLTGVIDYQHVIVPTNFTEDRWIQAAEVRPTERMVVHHIIAFVREPKSNWFRGQAAGVFFIAPQVKTKEEPDTSALPSDFLVGYAPGQPAEILRPGQAKLIKAGSDIVFQVHYTPHGHAVHDRSRLGIVFAKSPPKERVLTLSAVNGTFKIPPGHPNYQVDASFEVGADVKLLDCIRMHGRGKTSSTGRSFRQARRIRCGCRTTTGTGRTGHNLTSWSRCPKGTTIACTAHFDNSPNNPENADPTREVAWGEQSWDEMMVGFFNLVFDARLPVEKLCVKKPKAEIAAQ